MVGRAAAWDLKRRGHTVTLADVNEAASEDAATSLGIDSAKVDVADDDAVRNLMRSRAAVISAVPYSFGVNLANAELEVGCHYFDFGGNPTIVKHQARLDSAAAAADVAVVPDCGLAPGAANVMAKGLIESATADFVDSVQIRVGCLPQHPSGALKYQLAFYPGGLINEYAEPCEVIEDGLVKTVEPLTRFEDVPWDRWGPLEAFATAGGTSTMCQDYAGRVGALEYKTLRYPGHGIIFRAMRELGLFEEEVRRVGDVTVAPRALLLDLLTDNLPAGGPDVVLVRVEMTAGNEVTKLEIEDVHDGTFSALARTTAFPATALCELILRGEVGFRGAAAMSAVAPVDPLLNELAETGISVARS